MVGLQNTKFPPVNLQQVIFSNIRIQGVSCGHKHYIDDIFKLLWDKKVSLASYK